MIAGGVEMVVVARLPVELALQLGVGAVSTFLFSGMLVVLGLITWFTPGQHMITGSLAGFIALGALVLSNLGGLVIGSLFTLIGGGLAFAWRPVARSPRSRRRHRRGRHAHDDGPHEPAPGPGPGEEDMSDDAPTEPLPPSAPQRAEN